MVGYALYRYCKPQYTFPTQQEVIEFAVGKCCEATHRFPGTVIVSGTYKVGKERLYLALAEALGSRICVTKEKEHVLKCLQWPALESLLTTSPLEASVHVLPMMKLNVKVHLTPNALCVVTMYTSVSGVVFLPDFTATCLLPLACIQANWVDTQWQETQSFFTMPQDYWTCNFI